VQCNKSWESSRHSKADMTALHCTSSTRDPLRHVVTSSLSCGHTGLFCARVPNGKRTLCESEEGHKSAVCPEESDEVTT